MNHLQWFDTVLLSHVRTLTVRLTYASLNTNFGWNGMFDLMFETIS